MSMKKTIISVISGAVAGGMIASVMTLGAVGLIDKKELLEEPSYVSYSENDFAMLSGEAENKKEELSVEEIAKRVGPSIVGISCTSIVQSYFGAQQSESGGSGIIIDDKGHIVTNYHVIEGGSKIKVKLTSGNEYEASVVGGD